MTFRKRFHRFLMKGSGKQLLLLAVFCIMLVLVLLALSKIFFGDMRWQDIVAVFINRGIFSGENTHDAFRLLVSLIGLFAFSSALISMFTNILMKKADSYKNGEARYKFSDHILIFGANYQLVEMLRALNGNGSTGDVLVMTKSSVADLRNAMEVEFRGESILSRLDFYKGDRTVAKDVSSCCPEKASRIFVIGENHEEGHDASSIKCVALLKEMCKGSGRKTSCFVSMEDGTSVEVFRYLSQTESSSDGSLSVDFVPSWEYQAEQLLVYTDFLPAIAKDSDKHSHIVILGRNVVAKALAFTAAHISHYPNFKEGQNRTMITFIAPGMRSFMESMVVSMKDLFSLCQWTYVSPDGNRKVHVPSKEMGNYMDIEWQFVDAKVESFLAQDLLREWAEDSLQELSVIAADTDHETSIRNVLNLPDPVYSRKIAMYLDVHDDLVALANKTGVFGNIIAFGPTSRIYDALFERRFAKGQKVNFIYDQAYMTPKSANPEEAWSRIPEAHKYSSIYSANAIPLRLRCFDMSGEREPIYEAEHRRWMTSVLLLGYSALGLEESKDVRSDRERFKQLKSEFVHADVTPYDTLPEEEKDKDKIIIDATDYIMS